MRLVTFARAQAPHGVGDTRLVSESTAKSLRGEGVIDDLGEAWPPRAEARAPQKPSRPIGTPDSRVAKD